MFDLDQSNVYRDIEKIEGLIKQCLPITQKLYNITKRLKTRKEVEEYFPGFMAITDRLYQDQQRIGRKENYSTQARKRNTPSRTFIQ
ncbi:MAG: hypothetical protein L0H55_07745 [Candidatus Nitrosocosmicus sp.]|nr:hypothetical protein [Candidatus Nitrosocosmicus sp.]